MKKLISSLLALLLASLLLTGCSSDALQVYLPGSYILDDLVDEFTEQTGIKVKLNLFDSNEDAYVKLEGGDVYDVIIPSDYMIEKLIDENMLRPIDKSIITNLDQLYDGVKNMEYDPDNTYTVPYFWGNVGICYDTREIDPADVESQGWEVFRNTKYAGKLYFYDSARDEFMIAEKSLGLSMNETDKNKIDEAKKWLRKITDTMEPSFVTDEAIDGLMNPKREGFYYGMMYSGDAANIISENENARFFAPSEGTNYFVDAMCIHKDTTRFDEACQFINFMISYDAQIANSTEVGYSSVNAKALQDLASGVFAGNEAYIPREKNEKDETFHNNESIREYLNEAWLDVKNN